MVTNKTYYEGVSFFSEFRKYEDMSTAECFEKLYEVDKCNYWEAKTVFSEYDLPRKVITYIQTSIYSSKPYGFLITMINEDKLWNLFGKQHRVMGKLPGYC